MTHGFWQELAKTQFTKVTAVCLANIGAHTGDLKCRRTTGQRCDWDDQALTASIAEPLAGLLSHININGASTMHQALCKEHHVLSNLNPTIVVWGKHYSNTKSFYRWQNWGWERPKLHCRSADSSLLFQPPHAKAFIHCCTLTSVWTVLS